MKSVKHNEAELNRHLIDYGCEFFPSLIESAQGSVVRDVAGREILDFTSGQMCAALDHSHPEVVAAIEKAMCEAIHVFSGMIGVPVVRLAEELAALLPSNLQKMYKCRVETRVSLSLKIKD